MVVNDAARNWWLRTPNSTNANNVRNVNTSGALNNNNANNANGLAPDWEKCSHKVSFTPKSKHSCKEPLSQPKLEDTEVKRNASTLFVPKRKYSYQRR